MRAWLQRLLGKKPSTIWVSHPIFLQHEPGRNHPEAPARISAISAELQQQGIWRKLWRLEAEEADERQLALVHPSKYLNYLEARQPQNGKIARIDDDTVMSSHSLSAARCGAGAVIKAVDRVMQGRPTMLFVPCARPGTMRKATGQAAFA